jgi:ankyrin repeat protein
MNEDTLDDESVLVDDQKIIKKASEEIFLILESKDESKILNELFKNEYSNINFTLIINPSNDNTVLTSLVNYNLTETTIKFITFLKKKIKNSNDFLNYINQKNKKGYNALLYSAFRGNFEIFNKLIEIGADTSISNSSGLNALHLASQGNFPNIIVFLIEKCGFDINSKDNKGNTALHWAVYMDSRQSIDFLVYYGIDMKIKNENGETPLDMAINRNNKYIQNKFEEEYKILVDSKSKNIELSEIDGNNVISLVIFLFKRLSKMKQIFPYLIVIIINEAINQIIIINGYYNFFMSFVFFIFFFLSIFFYFITSKSDPGDVSDIFINSLTLLAQKGEDLKNICPWCINVVNKNTYHCFFCKKCVNYQEFHDIYLNNCIGRNNFNLYINFLYYMIIVFIFKFLIAFWGLFSIRKENYKSTIGFILLQILNVSFCIYFFIKRVKEKIEQYNQGAKLFKRNSKDNECDTNNTKTISEMV